MHSDRRVTSSETGTIVGFDCRNSKYARILERVLQNRFFYCGKDESNVGGIRRLCEATAVSKSLKSSVQGTY